MLLFRCWYDDNPVEIDREYPLSQLFMFSLPHQGYISHLTRPQSPSPSRLLPITHRAPFGHHCDPTGDKSDIVVHIFTNGYVQLIFSSYILVVATCSCEV